MGSASGTTSTSSNDFAQPLMTTEPCSDVDPPTVLLLSRLLPDRADMSKGIFVVDQAEALAGTCRPIIRRVAPGSRNWMRGRFASSHLTSTGTLIQDLYYPAAWGRLTSAGLAIRLLWLFWREGRPDIIHIHWSRGMLGAVIAGRMLGIPVVVTEHGGSWANADPGSPRLRGPRRTLNLADAVIPVSNWLEKQLRNGGVTTATRVIPNIVDPHVFFPAREAQPTGGGCARSPRGLCGTPQRIPKGTPRSHTSSPLVRRRQQAHSSGRRR